MWSVKAFDRKLSKKKNWKKVKENTLRKKKTWKKVKDISGLITPFPESIL